MGSRACAPALLASCCWRLWRDHFCCWAVECHLSRMAALLGLLDDKFGSWAQEYDDLVLVCSLVNICVGDASREYIYIPCHTPRTARRLSCYFSTHHPRRGRKPHVCLCLCRCVCSSCLPAASSSQSPPYSTLSRSFYLGVLCSGRR